MSPTVSSAATGARRRSCSPTGVTPALHRGLIDLAFCLARVVRNLQLQSVLGDVEAALEQLDAAAARLRKGGPLPLGSEPPPHLRITHLRWTTTRLVQRELADLMALRLLVEELRRGIQELVCACVEYLTLVEFDPWTVLAHRRLDRELTGLKPAPYARWRSGNRLDICGGGRPACVSSPTCATDR